MRKGIITSADVARMAEVSQSAVSRTFTPGASVSKETKARVLEAAEALGYRPNALARAMISGQSKMIAMMFAYLENQFYPVLLEHMCRALQDKGYHPLLFMTETGNQDDVVRRLMDYQVQGLVLVSATLSSDLATRCGELGIPVLLLNRETEDGTASCVASDNFGGGRMVAEHFINTGRKKIAYIAGDENSSTNRDREAGLLSGLKEHGMQLHARAVANYNHDQATQVANAMLAADDRPDAIFVANDYMAFAVIDVIRDKFGLSVPKDIAVAGYDDVPEASWAPYQLTTVRQSSEAMTDNAVMLLTEQIDGKRVEPQTIRLPAELIVRASA
ncbi:MAG: LacI family DNA-binding transcriptional regulator [Pseudomonadota bacterium]